MHRPATAATAAVVLVATLALAPVASADVCCGTADVTFDPPRAQAGKTVTLDGLVCVDPANGTQATLASLRGFWLTRQDDRAFLDDPARPDPAEWPAFASVPDPNAKTGSATIVVPSLRDGRYNLWWACQDAASADSYVLHASTGSRLVVGPPPETATETAPEPTPTSPRADWLLVLAGGAGVVAYLVRKPRGRPDAGAR
jgi:hypothetical protein